MGACGCSEAGKRYKLPGPGDDTYVIILHPSCTNCCVGTTVEIVRVPPVDPEQCDTWELDYVEELPALEVDGLSTNMIKASIDQDAFRALLESAAFDDIDDISLGVVADEVYPELPAPEVVIPRT